MANTETAAQILDLAQELVQLRGYNAFSYRDIAEQVGIQTASIHYHFPTKAHLGRALVVRYRERFLAALSQIDATTTDPKLKLKRYIELYKQTLSSKGKLCLCGM